MPVIWSPSALREIARIFEYVQDFNPRAAEQVAASLIATCDALAAFPHRGSPVPDTTLREAVAAYPHITRYRIARDHVRILRVRHMSRRPTNP